MREDDSGHCSEPFRRATCGFLHGPLHGRAQGCDGCPLPTLCRVSRTDARLHSRQSHVRSIHSPISKPAVCTRPARPTPKSPRANSLYAPVVMSSPPSLPRAATSPCVRLKQAGSIRFKVKDAREHGANAECDNPFFPRPVLIGNGINKAKNQGRRK